jgi:hypothetical protein
MYKNVYVKYIYNSSPRTYVVPHLFFICSQPQYIKPSAQIRMYDAEDVFE